MELDEAKELTLAFKGCWHEWEYHPGGYGPGGGYTAWRTCIHCCMQVFGYVDKTPKNRYFTQPEDYFWLIEQMDRQMIVQFIKFMADSHYTLWVDWELESAKTRCSFIYEWKGKVDGKG